MNPARQGYDYSNGRGLDGFLSAAIDEVSWETSLESTMNTLSQAPIGQPSAYSNLSTNYDNSQLSGSQSGTTALGGSGGSSAGAAGSGNLQIDSTNSRVTVSDGTNTRVILGLQSDSSFGLRVSKPGSEATSNDLIFNSQQIIGSVTFGAQTLTDPGGGVTFNYQAIIPHNFGFVPDYTVLATTTKYANAAASQFPAQFFIPIVGVVASQQASTVMGYLYFSGVDTTNLYLSLELVNQSGGTLTSVPITFQYYIRQVKAV